MDPISAFALAGTVVTFVELSGKLIKGARQLYKTTSGALTGNEELELITADFKSVIAKIQAYTAASGKVGKNASLSPADAEFEESFTQMCENAKELAEQLLNRLEGLKVGKDIKGASRVWASLSQAVSSAWSSGEIAALASKLKNLKEFLDFRIISDLRKNLDILSQKVAEGFHNLDSQTQTIISALAQSNASHSGREIDEFTLTLTKLLARLESSNSHEHRKTREMIAAVGHHNREVIPSTDVLEIPHEREQKIRKLVNNGILVDLNFYTRTHRSKEIVEAHQRTFEWVFDESTKKEKRWASLSEWLRQGEGVYWIQGKAGAGKSTLMSFIYEDPRTIRYLKKWASGSTPLYIGSFFF